jgi:hypothetical protein
MSNFVSTLEEQVSFVEEIELTDEQLVTVFGAHDDHHHPHNNGKKASASKSVKLSKMNGERFGFSLDISISLDLDEDEEEKEIWND